MLLVLLYFVASGGSWRKRSMFYTKNIRTNVSIYFWVSNHERRGSELLVKTTRRGSLNLELAPTIWHKILKSKAHAFDFIIFCSLLFEKVIFLGTPLSFLWFCYNKRYGNFYYWLFALALFSWLFGPFWKNQNRSFF